MDTIIINTNYDKTLHHSTVIFLFLLMIVASSCLALLQQDSSNNDDKMFENFVEGYVKDLFNKELSTANRQNLTDCITRLLCESICQRTVNGEIKKEPLLNSAEMLGRTEKDPLGYFFTGGDRGYEFGKRNQCNQCAVQYFNCPANQYDYTRSISDNYEKNMLKNAESSLSSTSIIDKDFIEI